MNASSIALRRIAPIFLLGAVIFLLFWLFWFGKIVVPASNGTAYDVAAGAKILKPGQSARLRPGSYTVSIRGPRLLKKTEKIFIWPFLQKTVTNQQKELSDEELVAHAMGIKTNDARLYGVEYFEKGTWFVAYVGPADVETDLGPTIAKYQAGTWSIVDGGTGVEFSTDKKLPASVREYFRGIRL